MTVSEYRHDDDDDDDDDDDKHWCFQLLDRANPAILLTFLGLTLTSVDTGSWLAH